MVARKELATPMAPTGSQIELTSPSIPLAERALSLKEDRATELIAKKWDSLGLSVPTSIVQTFTALYLSQPPLTALDALMYPSRVFDQASNAGRLATQRINSLVRADLKWPVKLIALGIRACESVKQNPTAQGEDWLASLMRSTGASQVLSGFFKPPQTAPREITLKPGLVNMNVQPRMMVYNKDPAIREVLVKTLEGGLVVVHTDNLNRALREFGKPKVIASQTVSPDVQYSVFQQLVEVDRIRHQVNPVIPAGRLVSGEAALARLLF